MILSERMSCILPLAILLSMPFFAAAAIEDSGIYKAYNITKVHYLASKYTPTFVPCKYGVELAFDQAHFVPLPTGVFKRKRECPSGCETMTVTLPGTDTLATVCCLPETPWKHLKTISIQSGHGIRNVEELMGKLQVTHWLSLVFPDIVPRKRRNASPKADASQKKESARRSGQRVPMAVLGYMVLGAAFAQLFVLFVVAFVFFVSKGRVELEAPPDCDYIIQPAVKVYNPSKSGMMMSDNMHSDLMSMSVAAV